MRLEQERIYDHWSAGYAPDLDMYIMKIVTGGIATYSNCFRLTEEEFRYGDLSGLHAKFFKKGTKSDRYLSPSDIQAIRSSNGPGDSSVYDYLIANDHLDCVPVAEDEICAAEEKMGREFPYELRWFYQDVGCGSVLGKKFLVNRIMSPAEAAGVVMPDRSIPFINVSDGAYVVLRSDGKVGYFDQVIADSLFEFWEKESKQPDYYLPG